MSPFKLKDDGRSPSLTVAYNVEGACDRFAGRVVTSAHTAFVPPGFGVQYMVTARLLLSEEANGRNE